MFVLLFSFLVSNFGKFISAQQFAYEGITFLLSSFLFAWFENILWIHNRTCAGLVILWLYIIWLTSLQNPVSKSPRRVFKLSASAVYWKMCISKNDVLLIKHVSISFSLVEGVVLASFMSRNSNNKKLRPILDTYKYERKTSYSA